MKIENQTAFEALQLGAADNLRYDQLIREKKLPYDWYWTRRMVAYAKAGEPFGKIASFTDPGTGEIWQTNVPKKFQGKKNIVLLASIGKSESKKDGNKITLTPKKITAKKMPEKDGWRLTDELGFPSGKESSENDVNARKLYHRDASGYVGLLSRGYSYGYVGRSVVAYGWPSVRFGVWIDDSPTTENGCPNLKPLAFEAEKDLNVLRNVVKEDCLARIVALVEAAKK